MFRRRSLSAFLILVIAMAGFAPFAGAATPANSDMSAMAMSMPSDCHEQVADTKADTTSPCKTDAACAVTCIMHAFQLSFVSLPTPVVSNAVLSPVAIHDLVSRKYGPDIRPPIV